MIPIYLTDQVSQEMAIAERPYKLGHEALEVLFEKELTGTTMPPGLARATYFFQVAILLKQGLSH